jgi:ABC-type nitrate/sulfonate/bicarbonate transport system substrate-binding protein
MALVAAACGGDDDAEVTTTAGGQATTTAGAQTTTTTSAPDTTAPEAMEEVNLVAVHGSSPDFIALVPAAAWSILAEDGINVEQRYVEDATIAVQAMLQGEAQIGTNIGVNVGLLAVDQGAAIVDVIATQRPTWAFVSRDEFSSFEELDGKTVGVHSETSFTKALSEFYMREKGITLEQLIIPGSEVRAEALANDQVDSSVIDLPDIVRLSATYPGSFVVLETVGETLPMLIEQDIWMAKDWVDENPELAKHVVEGLILGIRKLIDDPAFGLQLATELLPDEDPAQLEQLINEYSTRGLWDPNGILTPETADFTVRFFADLDEIDVDPDAIDLTKYFAFDLLDSALAEVGRR